ncbi:5-formyltetrahydrofolate cyclo-ligase [Bartonella tamiae Th307]|uniref:5-formyltetrahydrofolate cyclo-ligase n=2 Tax=Bartonella tamiae TaxID=373638 RepID=J0R7P5_9HYPH|nr:5-formyltetrahydrofolate cyclo-ligase [Bartonella tamiae Th239]EJF92578.1 5-formyltetrahydrofolate cyclo-ligase [Bartonella tamiae Th307]
MRMVNNKKNLRLDALKRRDAMAFEERLEISKKLAYQRDVLKPFLKDKRIIAGFWPIRSEIDPRPLLDALKKEGLQCALPALIDEHTMIFRLYDEDSVLIDVGFGTYGPSQNSACVIPDLILMPLSAFDDQGNRLGYGKGFYDRALKDMNKMGHKPLLIGLAFDCQKFAVIPAETHDVPLNMIWTESGLRIF